MKALFVAVALLAVPALAAEKECAAISEDGGVMHSTKYQVGKLSECREAVKAEVAKAMCKPGDKKVKFQFRTDVADKPSSTSATCPPAEPAK